MMRTKEKKFSAPLALNTVLLKVNKQGRSSITQFIELLERPVEDYLAYHRLNIARQRYGKSPNELAEDELKKTDQIALRQMMIENAVLVSKEATQISIKPQEIIDTYQTVITQYQDDHGCVNFTDFKQSLARCHLNENSLCEALIRQLCVERVMQHIADQIKPASVDQARDYYQTNIDKFIQPAHRTARHILITIQEDLPDNTFDKALERAKKIADHLTTYPQDFEKQALKYSECPTALQGGKLGKVTKGVLFPELEKMLFAMQADQISHVVQSEIGFHILYCESIHDEHVAQFDEVQPDLIAQLTGQLQQRRQKNWLKAILDEWQSKTQDTVAQHDKKPKFENG